MAGLLALGVTFDQLGLDRRICKAISKLGFEHPTLIQEKTIPLALQGKDILGSAKTGSGKTGAYAIPALQKILLSKEAANAKRGVRCVVLLPTRELCAQVTETFQKLTAYCSEVTIADLGLDADETTQAAMLRDKPDVVITTPSRLLNFLKKNIVSLKICFETLIIDEADLTLSLGYDADIRALASYLPKAYQAFLMSATLDDKTREVRTLLLHNPVVLTLKDDAANNAVALLSENILRCADEDKFLVVYALLRLGLVQPKVLIFVNTIDRCFQLKLFLDRFSVSATVLNAELPRESRHHILKQFNDGIFNFLIATDELIQDLGAENEQTGPQVEEGEMAEVSVEADEDKPEKKEKKQKGDKKGQEQNGKGKRKAQDDEEDGEEKSDDEEEDNESDEEGDDSEDEEAEKDELNTSVKSEPGDDDDVQISKVTPKSNGVETPIEIKDEDMDEEIKTENGKGKKKKAKKEKKNKNKKVKVEEKDTEYSAARGIDFQNVQTVINFDFPASTKAYIHRIGRTARGGAKGLAVSLIGPNEEELLAKNQVKRSKVVPDFGFQIRSIEPFRYRSEDVFGSISSQQIKMARAETVRKEILNSSRLKTHFKDNPREKALLRHAHTVAALPLANSKRHSLRNIPNYLVPKALVNNVNQTSNSGQNERKRKLHSRKRKKSDPILAKRKK